MKDHEAAALATLKALFHGKDTPKEERGEAQAVRSGKITPAQYAKGEQMEGEKESRKSLISRGQRLKSGKLSASAYAKGKK